MKEKINNFLSLLRERRKIQVINPNSFEEKFSLSLSRAGYILSLLFIVLFIGFLSYLTISYTSLRKFIPGYPDIDRADEIIKKDIKNQQLIAELTEEMNSRDKWIKNLKNILSESDSILITDLEELQTLDSNYKKNIFERIPEDSILREKVENFGKEEAKDELSGILKEKNFVNPINGSITRNQSQGFWGVNIETDSAEAIRSPMEGSVFDIQGGTIIIYHTESVLTKYKNCAAIQVKIGEQLSRGKRIAQVQNDELHFELWYKGKSIDPKTILKE